MMEQIQVRVRYNLGGLLIGFLGFAAVIVYGSIALAAQDILWFLPGFNEKPVRIIVYNMGVRTVFEPGQPGFTELASAVVNSLNQGVERQSGIGLSEGSLQDAYTQYRTVEAFFSRPVKLHTPFYSHEATQMLFPISGRHSDLSIVFLGYGGAYLSNSPALNTTAPLRAALDNLGYK